MCSFTVPTRGCEFDTVSNALAYSEVELITDMYSFAVQTRENLFDTLTNALAYSEVEFLKRTYVALQYRTEGVNLTQ